MRSALVAHALLRAASPLGTSTPSEPRPQEALRIYRAPTVKEGTQC